MGAIEDEISNADTEDVLLKASRNGSDAIGSQKRKQCVPICYVITSVILLCWGLATVIWTPYSMFMNERLRMRPGFPPFDWWKNPPDEVFLKAYIFNVTNSEEFLKNPEAKLNMVEIGPIIFMEKLTHDNVTFNENSTITYVATRKAIFLPELNTINLNDTVIVPNWALLGMASYLAEQSFFLKFGFNLMIRTQQPKPFVKVTINKLLWDFNDPLLAAAHKMSPDLVPSTNLGILSRVYTNFVNTVTVYIGSKHGNEKFFLIDKYDGSSNLPHYIESCGGGVVNSSEGVAYAQLLTKNTTIRYWRRTFCKMALLRFKSEMSRYGIKAYRYNLLDSTFNRTEPKKDDCFRGSPQLPDGLSDVSRCHFGFPLASSFPHFLNGDEVLFANISGLKPNRTAHESFLLVEPLSGVPLESKARSQSNLVIRKLTGFNDVVLRFSNMVIPMFWLEYGQRGLPWYIITLLYFQVNILPILQWFFTAFLLVSSLVFGYLYLKIRSKTRLVANKVLVFEKESFVNKAQI